jgi:hypothetical protein
MMKYLPSMVAASAVFLSLKILGRGGWTATLHRHTHYSEGQLKNCTADLFGLLKSAWGKPLSRPAADNLGCTGLQAVKQKYANVKYGEVSKITIEGIYAVAAADCAPPRSLCAAPRIAVPLTGY